MLFECPKCREVYHLSTAVRCPFCGTEAPDFEKIKNARSRTEAKVLYECPVCREEYDPNQDHCAYCGASVADIGLEKGRPPAAADNIMLFECQNCKEGYDAAMPRCPYCGEAAPNINIPKAKPPKAELRILFECSNCKESYDSNMPRCPYCGTKAPKINPLEKPPMDTNISFIPADWYQRMWALFLDGALNLLIFVICLVIFKASNIKFLFILPMPLVISACYYIGFETSALMATPGKLYFGFAVVDLNGERISVPKAAARYLAKFISFPLLALGFIFPPLLGVHLFFTIISKKEQALHDFMSHCMVVKDGLI